MNTRTAPTPADLAIALTNRPCTRAEWERAVLDADLHPNTKLIALVLAHLAGSSGRLPTGGPQDAAQLARTAGLGQKSVRVALHRLELDGYLRRPDHRTWKARNVRPLTLVLPPAGGARTEPPHTGEAAR